MATTISMAAQDQALMDDVLCRIDHDPRVDASRVDVECEAGRVTLTGSVPWMYQKLAAEFDVKALPGVRAVENRIVVHSAISAEDVLDRIRGWLPALLALSANSPFWQGKDTKYSSYRSQAMVRWPTAGPTEAFGSSANRSGPNDRRPSTRRVCSTRP